LFKPQNIFARSFQNETAILNRYGRFVTCGDEGISTDGQFLLLEETAANHALCDCRQESDGALMHVSECTS
jgi:hypothetical protein